MTLSGRVNDQGELVWSNVQSYRTCLRSLVGKRVTVTIKRWRARRSTPQRNFCHGVMLPMIQARVLQQHIGCTDDELRHWLKDKFPGYFVRYIPIKAIGKTIPENMKVYRSWEDLTTKEQEDLNVEIRAWAWDFFGLTLPLPNEGDLEL